jgi:serine/threonine protein kinase
LLVGSDNIVKVGDFGMSRSAEKGYYTNNQAILPVKWSAPEVFLFGCHGNFLVGRVWEKFGKIGCVVFWSMSLGNVEFWKDSICKFAEFPSSWANYIGIQT